MKTAAKLPLVFIALLAYFIWLPLISDAQHRQEVSDTPDSLIATCGKLLQERRISSANTVITLLILFADTAVSRHLSYRTQEKIYKLLSHAYTEKADYKHAYEYLQRYQNIHDTLMNHEKETQINSLKRDYYIQKGSRDIINGRILMMEQNKILKKKEFLITLILIIFASAAILSVLYYQSYKRKLSLMRRTLQQADQDHSLRILETRVEAEEKERSHIAHYLRHTLYKDIEMIRHEFIHQKTKYTDPAIKGRFEELINVLSSAKDILHQSVYNLNTEEFNLEQELHKFVNHVNKGLFIGITITHEQPQAERDVNNELLIFRVVRELIQNVIKHAYATKASIDIRFDAEKVKVLVEDNGRGIDPEKLKDGMGLSSILKIADHYNGSVSINAAEGTQILLILPNHAGSRGEKAFPNQWEPLPAGHNI